MSFWDKFKGKGPSTNKPTSRPLVPETPRQAKPLSPRPPAPQRPPAPPPEELELTTEEPTREDLAFDADNFGGWDPNNFEEFWYRLKKIEEAGQKGGESAYEETCVYYGLQGAEHFHQVHAAFSRRFGHLHEFQQAAVNATMRISREEIQQAATPSLFEPIEGVTLEMYATISARTAALGSTDPQAYANLLREFGLTQEHFTRAQKGWTERMSRQDDPNASYALMMEYSKFFSAAGQGGNTKAAQSAKANAQNVGLQGKAGQAPVGGEPCTLEEYCEIMAAQSAWASQGKDVNAMLKSQFNMTALDWSNLSVYWSQKMTSDMRVAERFSQLFEQAQAKYSTPQDDDLDV